MGFRYDTGYVHKLVLDCFCVFNEFFSQRMVKLEICWKNSQAKYQYHNHTGSISDTDLGMTAQQSQYILLQRRIKSDSCKNFEKIVLVMVITRSFMILNHDLRGKSQW